MERKPDNITRTSSSVVCWAFGSSFRLCSRSRLDERNSSGRLLKSAGFLSRLPPLLSFPLPPEDGIGGGVLTLCKILRYFLDKHHAWPLVPLVRVAVGSDTLEQHSHMSRCRAQATDQMFRSVRCDLRATGNDAVGLASSESRLFSCPGHRPGRAHLHKSQVKGQTWRRAFHMHAARGLLFQHIACAAE